MDVDDDEREAIGGMIGRGNRSTRRKPAHVPLCPLQIQHDLTRAQTWAAAVGSQRLTVRHGHPRPVNRDSFNFQTSRTVCRQRRETEQNYMAEREKALPNRTSLRTSLLWLTLTLALIIQCLSGNNFFFFQF
jgi:hypothetical protein